MDSILQPLLEENGIVLRPLLEADFDALFQVASDPLIWEQHQNSDRYKLEVFKEFFKIAIASKGAFAIVDAKTKAIIGSSRYKINEDDTTAVEIGWSFLSRGYWGGEYNRIFKKLMVNHALKYFKRTVFYVDSKNLRSQNAMKKIGGIDATALDELWVRKIAGSLTFTIDKPIA